MDSPTSALVRGFTVLLNFAAMWITGSMFTVAIEARYRIAAIAPSRQGISIRLIISREMKCGMGAAT